MAWSFVRRNWQSWFAWVIIANHLLYPLSHLSSRWISMTPVSDLNCVEGTSFLGNLARQRLQLNLKHVGVCLGLCMFQFVTISWTSTFIWPSKYGWSGSNRGWNTLEPLLKSSPVDKGGCSGRVSDATRLMNSISLCWNSMLTLALSLISAGDVVPLSHN